jgi:hypothetical protein
MKELNKKRPSNAWPNKTSSMCVALGTISANIFSSRIGLVL